MARRQRRVEGLGQIAAIRVEFKLTNFALTELFESSAQPGGFWRRCCIDCRTYAPAPYYEATRRVRSGWRSQPLAVLRPLAMAPTMEVWSMS